LQQQGILQSILQLQQIRYLMVIHQQHLINRKLKLWILH